MTRKLRVLDLFSGIGGFSLGLEMTGGFETVCFVELDPFCRAVLRKHWPRVRQFKDVRCVSAARLGHAGVTDIDVICGGFPCQPYSVAGHRKGDEDDRHLWPEMCRIIASVKPAWVIGENVTGIIPMALDGVLADLEGLQYSTQSFVIPACAVDARHRRDRVWIVGRYQRARSDTTCNGRQQGRQGAAEHVRQPCRLRDEGRATAHAYRRELRNQPRRGDGPYREVSSEPANDGAARSLADATQQSRREQADEAIADSVGRRSRDESRHCGASVANSDCTGWGEQGRTVAVPTPFPATECSSEHVADTSRVGMEGHWTVGERVAGASAHARVSRCNRAARGAAQWSVEPGVGRVVDGLSGRVHRLKSLGNAVVPQLVAEIGYAILAATEP